MGRLKVGGLVLALLLIVSGCENYRLTVRGISPSGNFEARLNDREVRILGALDRNFSVTIKDNQSGTEHTVLARSQDEGRPPTERFIWSKDERYLLLVGKSFFVKPAFKLNTGETLYLLYDRQEQTLKLNSGQTKSAHFDPEALEGIEFEETLQFRSPIEASPTPEPSASP